MIERLAGWSRSCLTMQGYGSLSDEERRSLWLGLRFSTGLCFAGIALGTALASPALLLAMAVTALVGGFLTPKHPFDYVYDAALRPLLGGPSVPPSPAPRRFACQLATPWIAAIAVAFLAGAPRLPGSLPCPCSWWRQRSPSPTGACPHSSTDCCTGGERARCELTSLRTVHQKGGQFFVCPICFGERDLDEQKLVESAELKGAHAADGIRRSGATTFTY